jgi:hypothetical protein
MNTQYRAELAALRTKCDALIAANASNEQVIGSMRVRGDVDCVCVYVNVSTCDLPISHTNGHPPPLTFTYTHARARRQSLS